MHNTLFFYLRLFCFLYLLSCTHRRTETTVQSGTTTQNRECYIQSVKDSSSIYNIYTTGFNFICGKTSLSYNFRANNPWRKVRFPVITESNRFLGLNSERDIYAKAGMIDYDLNYAPYQAAREEFDLINDESLSPYFLTLAMSHIENHNYSPHWAIANYSLTLMGTTDTIMRKDLEVIFFSDKLNLFDSLGQITYHLNRDHQWIGGIIIDTLTDFMVFRTLEIQHLSSRYGIEVHDLKMDSLLAVFQISSEMLMSDGIQKDRFIFFKIYERKSHRFKEVLILDLDQRVIRRKTFRMPNPYDEIIIMDQDLIVSNTISDDSDEQQVIDTFSIDRIPILKSLK